MCVFGWCVAIRPSRAREFHSICGARWFDYDWRSLPRARAKIEQKLKSNSFKCCFYFSFFEGDNWLRHTTPSPADWQQFWLHLIRFIRSFNVREVHCAVGGAISLPKWLIRADEWHNRSILTSFFQHDCAENSNINLMLSNRVRKRNKRRRS